MTRRMGCPRIRRAESSICCIEPRRQTLSIRGRGARHAWRPIWNSAQPSPSGGLSSNLLPLPCALSDLGLLSPQYPPQPQPPPPQPPPPQPPPQPELHAQTCRQPKAVGTQVQHDVAAIAPTPIAPTPQPPPQPQPPPKRRPGKNADRPAKPGRPMKPARANPPPKPGPRTNPPRKPPPPKPPPPKPPPRKPPPPKPPPNRA
jgi:hypothetical protein